MFYDGGHMMIKRVTTFIFLLSVTFFAFSKNLESLASSEESLMSFIQDGRDTSIAILIRYMVPKINFYGIFMMFIIILIAIVFLIISSTISCIVKQKISKRLQIKYRNKDLSTITDVFIVTGTPISIFYASINSDKILWASLLMLSLILLNAFVFVKKESTVKYIILTIIILIIFSGLYFLLLFSYTQHFNDLNFN